MVYLAVGTIVRDESLYIKEWLDSHLQLGVERFYIGLNTPMNDLEVTQDILAPYVVKGIVRTYIYEGQGVQNAFYKKLVRMVSTHTHWLACIDVDEFLYCKTKELPKCLEELDKKGVAGIAVNWLMFGSNGHTEYSTEPVVKRFTKRKITADPHVKSIIKPIAAIEPLNNIHCFRYKTGKVINEKGIVLPLHHGYGINTTDVLAINHYIIKSKTECILRRNKSDVYSGTVRRGSAFCDKYDFNDVEDTFLKEKLYG